MTHHALAGLPAVYYPDGRARQRPATLRPRDAESPGDVVASLADESHTLEQAWRAASESKWSTQSSNRPTGRTSGRPRSGLLALLRLTEVEVHGTDRNIGHPNWSDSFVSTALHRRLTWLNTRRANHCAADEPAHGSWPLTASEGPTFLVTTDETGAQTEPVEPNVEADVTIEATSRDLLALLLGRAPTIS
jgi:hypothetical protein